MKKLFDVFVLTKHEQVLVIVLLTLWITAVLIRHQRLAREQLPVPAAAATPTAVP